MLRKMIREPLLHFLALGLLLFVAWYGVAPQASITRNQEVIVVDQAQLDHLETLWKAQWKRDPAPQEVAAIIDRHLRKEVFYREAKRMGLDQDDEIIRTRLAQKMEAVASDLSTLTQPISDEQLQAFYTRRPDLFTLPANVAFRQLLFTPAEITDNQLDQILASLRAGGEAPTDRLNTLSLDLDWPLTPLPNVENSFGGAFAQSLSKLPLNTWSGPVRSGLGLHLVQVTAYQPAQLAPFESIRELVKRQYEYYSVLDAQERAFRELIDQYRVQINARGVPDEIIQEYSR